MTCSYQCTIETKQRPIKMLVDWWNENSFDFESSICMLNMALKYDL